MTSIEDVPRDLIPGSADWMQMITASKVAVIMGVAPSSWGGPRKLWNLMTGRDPGEPQTDVMARGHYLEPGVLAWFYDQHPTMRLDPLSGQTVFSRDLPWAAGKPDAIVITEDMATEFVEAKTSAEPHLWGQPGTDQIPDPYLVQTMWQMHVTGGDVTRTYVPVLGAYLKFDEYFVNYDRAFATLIENRCWAFMKSVRYGIPVRMDDTEATYESMRRVHPEIVDGKDVEITPQLAWQFADAQAAVQAAAAQWNLAKSSMADVMKDAKRATCGRIPVAERRARANSKTPWVQAPTKPIDTASLPERTAA